MERSSIGFFRTTMKVKTMILKVRMMVQILMDGEEKDEKVINPKKVKTMILKMPMKMVKKKVETIMDKADFTLEELLDEDEIIQECKALNIDLVVMFFFFPFYYY